MTTRTINKVLLKNRIKDIGLELVAVKAGISASLLQKLVSEAYTKTPSLRTVDGLCEATGEKLNDLFPLDQEKEEVAS